MMMPGDFENVKHGEINGTYLPGNVKDDTGVHRCLIWDMQPCPGIT
ncbi:hypothetical protein BRYFOR_08345 [Marvinbryantia formatexigens DSM 14469]|uniref:Uncharacterized protein n=1 Tax=Marvinbryantia formatexigens DSM 14469 TaxID=478749 RepID=C6LI74_9FIRM|nr:hypothetical protein BRYFOR_08345 [Marvinbryantia formatexigens DSM 14469]